MFLEKNSYSISKKLHKAEMRGVGVRGGILHQDPNNHKARFTACYGMAQISN